MSPGHRPTPTGWAVIAVVGVVCAAAVVATVVEPAPTGHAISGSRGPSAVASGDASGPPPTMPPLDEPWYRTGLPVEGEIVPIGARTTGHVEVVRSGDRSIRVTISDFATDLTTADIRVQLTAGDVIESRHGARWVPDGDPVEIGVVRHGATSAVIDMQIPQILPDAVHSMVILDWNTTTIMGGAELLPGYGTMDG